MPPLSAIIMRSKNEMPHVRTALEMLTRQTFTDFELFVIDSGSTDGSLELLREHCDADHLAEIPPEDYQPGKVLNEAIARIEHQTIVLLNADAIPQSDRWLEKLLHPILYEAADATFSQQIPRPDASFIVAYDYRRAYDPKKSSTRFFSAVACAFKRELWVHHHFHNQGYAEDAIWATACNTFGGTLQLVPESKVEHSHNYSLTGLFYKKFRHGCSLAKIEGKPSALGHRLYLCVRELTRDLVFTCQQRQFRTIPYNIAYRVTIHAGLHRGLKAGSK
jgi:rhamnosyltransferase